MRDDVYFLGGGIGLVVVKSYQIIPYRMRGKRAEWCFVWALHIHCHGFSFRVFLH